MNVDLDVRDQASPYLSAVFSRQMPFAESLALNRTALDFQAAQRRRIHDVFTVRRSDWVNRAVKIKPFATKQRPEVRISIDPPGRKADVLGKFESDTEKRPLEGRSIAVPTDVQRARTGGVVRRAERPGRLLDDKKRGAFIVRRPGGRGTIFERIRGAGVRALYQLVPSVDIEPELGFVQTARRVIAAKWPANFRDAFERAIRTAR